MAECLKLFSRSLNNLYVQNCQKPLFIKSNPCKYHKFEEFESLELLSKVLKISHTENCWKLRVDPWKITHNQNGRKAAVIQSDPWKISHFQNCWMPGVIQWGPWKISHIQNGRKPGGTQCPWKVFSILSYIQFIPRLRFVHLTENWAPPALLGVMAATD